MGTSLLPADPHAPLRGTFDVDEAVLATPEAARTKGMFFRPLRSELGADYDALEPRLLAPPRLGRYMHFVDYPSRDHVRLIDAVARKRFPSLTAREAHRRLGFESFDTFARSTIGAVTFGLLRGDVAAAMMRFGEGYALLVKNTQPVQCTAREDGGVDIVFIDTLAVPEYVLGIFEAIVRRGGKVPRVFVRQQPGAAVRFEVRWT